MTTMGDDIHSGRGMNENLHAVRDDLPGAAGNPSSIAHRLPPELLGSCFTFLSLDDCIWVSHVSRRWRAIALSTPSAWAHITMDCDSASELEGLCTLLSRTGEVPVVLRFSGGQETSEHAFRTAALPHLHHLYYLQILFCRVDAATLIYAPMLRYLLIHDTLEIPENFLGERATLRSLFFTRGSLPAVCPSLSMLVALHVRQVHASSYAASFRRLFDICPRLEFLSLSGLHAENDALLPPGPAPSSLQTLFLATMEEDYDLMPRYAAWKTSKLRHVMLDMGRALVAYPIPQDFLDRAVTLSITLSLVRGGGRWIVADFPDGGRRALGASERDDVHIAEFMVTVLPGLRHVHTLCISLDAVGSLFDVVGNLPALRHLAIFIDWTTAYDELDRAYMVEPDLSDLGVLVHIANAVPHLESLLVQMRLSLSQPGREINKTDAEDLLAFFESLGPLMLPEMVIQGFHSHTLEGLDQARLDRLRVRFDAEGMQPYDVRFDDANANMYWPFGYNG